jgi:regulatory protein
LKELSEETIIHRVALNYLARRDHSKLELTNKLENKGYSTTLIEVVIQELKTKRLLNDAHFAENYCHMRRNRGYGPLRIIAELQVRGIAAETIAEVVEITDNEWFIVAHHLWQKRFKNQQPNDFTRRAKQMRFLQYRGFTREQIDNIFN